MLCICNFKRNANELTVHHSFNMLLVLYFFISLFLFFSRVNFSVKVVSLCYFSMLYIHYFKRFLNGFIRKSTEYHSFDILLMRSLMGGFYFKRVWPCWLGLECYNIQ